MSKKKDTKDHLNNKEDKQENEQAQMQEETKQDGNDKPETDNWQDKYLRVLAEFDNYKKRTNREKEQVYSDAVIDTVASILPVMDSLERAVAASTVQEEEKGILEGVQALKRQLQDILLQMGVSAIEAVGKEFDPLLHNAVMHIEDEAYDSNVVVEEFSKGYQYKDKVIRHSMVKVAN